MAAPQQAIPQTKISTLEKKMLFARIAKLESLPLPSYSMLELSNVLKGEVGDVDAIAATIAHDHVLLAQVYRLFYQTYPGVQPGSLAQIIETLPGDQLKSLIYVPRQLDSFEHTEEVEWNHSYSSKILMQSILEDNEIESPDLIVAAHLHDIGKNVFRDWSPKKYKLVENHAESSNNVPIYRLEDAVLQTNHAEVGAELLKAWGFPESIWMVVANHHKDQVPEKYPFETALLQFVNWIDCKARGIECEAPTKELMLAAGIEEIDAEGYTQAQKNLIANLKSGNAGSIRKNMLNELLAAEQAVLSVVTGKSGDEAPQESAEAAEQPAQEAAPEQAPKPDEEEEAEEEFDAEKYVAAASIPSAMAQREEELLRKMKLKK